MSFQYKIVLLLNVGSDDAYRNTVRSDAEENFAEERPAWNDKNVPAWPKKISVLWNFDPCQFWEIFTKAFKSCVHWDMRVSIERDLGLRCPGPLQMQLTATKTWRSSTCLCKKFCLRLHTAQDYNAFEVLSESFWRRFLPFTRASATEAIASTRCCVWGHPLNFIINPLMFLKLFHFFFFCCPLTVPNADFDGDQFVIR